MLNYEPSFNNITADELYQMTEEILARVKKIDNRRITIKKLNSTDKQNIASQLNNANTLLQLVEQTLEDML